MAASYQASYQPPPLLPYFNRNEYCVSHALKPSKKIGLGSNSRQLPKSQPDSPHPQYGSLLMSQASSLATDGFRPKCFAVLCCHYATVADTDMSHLAVP